MSAQHQSGGYKMIAITVCILAVPLSALILFIPDSDGPAKLQVEASEGLAVLPFSYEANTEQIYLADYLSGALTEALARRINRNVIEVNQTGHLGQSDLEFGLILKGFVQSSNEDTLVAIRLMDRQKNRVIWNQTYRYEQETLAILDQIIAADLKFYFTGVREEVPANVMQDASLYHAYLKGRYFLKSGTQQGMYKASLYLTRVAEQAPDYAPAHSALARLYGLQDRPAKLPVFQRRRLARSHLEKGLTLDESLPELHLVRGTLLFEREWRLLEAEQSLRKAVRLHPTDRQNLEHLALFLGATGRQKEAQQFMDQAVGFHPGDWQAYYHRGRLRLMSGDVRGAHADFAAAIAMGSQSDEARIYAFITRERLPEENQEQVLTSWVSELPLTSRLKVDFARLKDVRTLSPRGRRSDLRKRRLPETQPPSFFAVLCMQANQKDLAFAWLEKARDTRDAHLLYLIQSPIFEDLRKQRRFKRLLSRIGLQPMS